MPDQFPDATASAAPNAIVIGGGPAGLYFAMLAKKALSQARNTRSISALENKSGIQ